MFLEELLLIIGEYLDNSQQQRIDSFVPGIIWNNYQYEYEYDSTKKINKLSASSIFNIHEGLHSLVIANPLYLYENYKFPEGLYELKISIEYKDYILNILPKGLYSCVLYHIYDNVIIKDFILPKYLRNLKLYFVRKLVLTQVILENLPKCLKSLEIWDGKVTCKTIPKSIKKMTLHHCEFVLDNC
jgi:hypothetical protein